MILQDIRKKLTSTIVNLRRFTRGKSVMESEMAVASPLLARETSKSGTTRMESKKENMCAFLRMASKRLDVCSTASNTENSQ